MIDWMEFGTYADYRRQWDRCPRSGNRRRKERGEGGTEDERQHERPGINERELTIDKDLPFKIPVLTIITIYAGAYS